MTATTTKLDLGNNEQLGREIFQEIRRKKQSRSNKVKTTKIYTTCEIYETETTIRDYGHKICVTEPFIRWENNTGLLRFVKWTTRHPEKMDLLRAFAEAESFALDNGDCWDMLDLI